jgi:hypothetical protein
MVNKQAQDAVQKSLDSVTSNPDTGIAGLVFVAVDKEGNEICAVPSGKKGVGENREKMDMEYVNEPRSPLLNKDLSSNIKLVPSSGLPVAPSCWRPWPVCKPLSKES